MKPNTLCQRKLNMNKDIKEIIENVNKDYLSLLKKLENIVFDSGNISAVMDEINIFWEIHRQNTLFVTKYISDFPESTELNIDSISSTKVTCTNKVPSENNDDDGDDDDDDDDDSSSKAKFIYINLLSFLFLFLIL